MSFDFDIDKMKRNLESDMIEVPSHMDADELTNWLSDLMKAKRNNKHICQHDERQIAHIKVDLKDHK